MNSVISSTKSFCLTTTLKLLSINVCSESLTTIVIVASPLESGVITSDCIRIKVDETKMDKMCLLLYIHSAYGKKQIKGMTQGVAQKKISLERFKKFEVPQIDNLEQKELVKYIQSRMSICENIEKTVNDALIQATAMRQSILKKAFEGDL